MSIKMLTEEQKVKVRKLERSSMLRGVFFSMKNMFLLLFMSALIVYLNFKYVNSDGFLMLAGLANGFLFGRLSYLDFSGEYIRAKTELDKILNTEE